MGIHVDIHVFMINLVMDIYRTVDIHMNGIAREYTYYGHPYEYP